MKHAIIFDGENEREVILESFFQDEVIEKLTPDKTVHMYQSTAVFVDVLIDLEKYIEKGTVKNVNDKAVDPNYVASAKKGLEVLGVMIVDMFGQDSADFIFDETKKIINETGYNE